MPVEDWHPRTTKISAADRVDAEQNENFLSVWKIVLRFFYVELAEKMIKYIRSFNAKTRYEQRR